MFFTYTRYTDLKTSVSTQTDRGYFVVLVFQAITESVSGLLFAVDYL